MNPLNVTLIHRDNDNYRNLCGWWSYPVDEFTWTPVRVQQVGFVASPKPDADMVALDDWIFGKVRKSGRPMVYWIVDSARSTYQLARNRDMAKQADLILVDSDDLNYFSDLGHPVRRAAYAVNEKLYYPRLKEYDVAFLCWPTPERRVIQTATEQICNKYGWTYHTATYTGFLDYAAAISKARIVVHRQHVERARSWRVFDVMASKGCLLTNVIPKIEGDGIVPGVHYHEYRDLRELEEQLIILMNGKWEQTAEAGFKHVINNHTWTTRAKELRQMFQEELSL